MQAWSDKKVQCKTGKLGCITVCVLLFHRKEVLSSLSSPSCIFFQVLYNLMKKSGLLQASQVTDKPEGTKSVCSALLLCFRQVSDGYCFWSLFASTLTQLNLKHSHSVLLSFWQMHLFRISCLSTTKTSSLANLCLCAERGRMWPMERLSVFSKRLKRYGIYKQEMVIKLGYSRLLRKSILFSPPSYTQYMTWISYIWLEDSKQTPAKLIRCLQEPETMRGTTLEF